MYNFNHRYILTLRDRISQKNPNWSVYSYTVCTTAQFNMFIIWSKGYCPRQLAFNKFINWMTSENVIHDNSYSGPKSVRRIGICQSMRWFRWMALWSFKCMSMNKIGSFMIKIHETHILREKIMSTEYCTCMHECNAREINVFRYSLFRFIWPTWRQLK